LILLLIVGFSSTHVDYNTQRMQLKRKKIEIIRCVVYAVYT